MKTLIFSFESLSGNKLFTRQIPVRAFEIGQQADMIHGLLLLMQSGGKYPETDQMRSRSY